MVTVLSREARDVSREIEDQLEARDIRGLGVLAIAGATGVIIAQEVTERVLPLLQMPREPSTPTQFFAAGGIKLAYALIIGAIATNISGLGLALLAFHAVGAVVFAGADLVNAVQQSSLLAEQPRGRPVPRQTSMSGQGGGSGNVNRPPRNGEGTGFSPYASASA